MAHKKTCLVTNAIFILGKISVFHKIHETICFQTAILCAMRSWISLSYFLRLFSVLHLLMLMCFIGYSSYCWDNVYSQFSGIWMLLFYMVLFAYRISYLQVPLEDEKRFRIEMTFSRGADLSPLEVMFAPSFATQDMSSGVLARY